MARSIVPGFSRRAAQMAQAGIFDVRIRHDDIVMLGPQWVLGVERLHPDRERAHEQPAHALAALDTQASRFEVQGAAADAKRAAPQPSMT